MQPHDTAKFQYPGFHAKAWFAAPLIMVPVIMVPVTLVLAMLLSSCSGAQHSESLHSVKERDMTLGNVQARITKGMSQGEVAEALGSPNIVSKDADGSDTWIYDKIATEASYSSDQGSVAGLGGAAGSSTLILGGLLGSYSRQGGASASTQKTLTVVIKYDGAQRVRSFSYHSSKF